LKILHPKELSCKERKAVGYDFRRLFFLWLIQTEQGLRLLILIHIAKATEMLFYKPYNIGFLIIGFVVYHLKGQLSGRTIALQGTFADVQHLAEVEVIEQTVAVRQQRCVLSGFRRLHLFELVETLHDTPHPAVEMVFIYKHG